MYTLSIYKPTPGSTGERRVVGELQVGHELVELGRLEDLPFGQLVAGKNGHRQRRILEVLFDAPRCDGDFLEAGRGRRRLRRELRRHGARDRTQGEGAVPNAAAAGLFRMCRAHGCSPY
jgi:hypothetical protein